MDPVNDPALRIELRLAPEWSLIEPVREAVRAGVGIVHADAQLQDAISMTAAELMENAIKYGSAAGNRVRLSIDEAGGVITVEMENRVPEGELAGRLAERIAWIASFPSAADAYAAAIRRRAEAESGTGESGLGLVRIAFEANCRLSIERTGPLLTVRARRRVAPPRAGSSDV
jgi:hypothetical protein